MPKHKLSCRRKMENFISRCIFIILSVFCVCKCGEEIPFVASARNTCVRMHKSDAILFKVENSLEFK